MSSSQQPDFSCSGHQLIVLSNLLKSMHLGKKKDQQYARINLIDDGLTLVASKAKSIISQCFLRKEYFAEWNLSEPVDFVVDISIMCQVISMYLNSITFHFEYKKANDYLRIFLSNIEDHSVTECNLYTICELTDDIPDLRWSEYRIVNRFMMNSHHLKDIFSEIDALARGEAIVSFEVKKGNASDPTVTAVDLFGDNEEKNMMNDETIPSLLKISVTSDTLQFEGCVPLNYEICEDIELNESAKYFYKLELLRPALRAAAKSNGIRIYFNEQSTMQIHHMFNCHETSNWGHVEFTILSQDSQSLESALN